MPGASPRSEELDDFLPSAGDCDLFREATLALRRIESGGMLGDEGVRRSSVGFLGELMLGDCGPWVLVAVWSERRFSGSEGRFASLFVCRAALGVPGPAPGTDCSCMVCAVWPRCGACLVYSTSRSLICVFGVKERDAL